MAFLWFSKKKFSNLVENRGEKVKRLINENILIK